MSSRNSRRNKGPMDKDFFQEKKIISFITIGDQIYDLVKVNI